MQERESISVSCHGNHGYRWRNMSMFQRFLLFPIPKSILCSLHSILTMLTEKPYVLFAVFWKGVYFSVHFYNGTYMSIDNFYLFKTFLHAGLKYICFYLHNSNVCILFSTFLQNSRSDLEDMEGDFPKNPNTFRHPLSNDSTCCLINSIQIHQCELIKQQWMVEYMNLTMACKQLTVTKGSCQGQS